MAHSGDMAELATSINNVEAYDSCARCSGLGRQIAGTFMWVALTMPWTGTPGLGRIELLVNMLHAVSKI